LGSQLEAGRERIVKKFIEEDEVSGTFNEHDPSNVVSVLVLE